MSGSDWMGPIVISVSLGHCASEKDKKQTTVSEWSMGEKLTHVYMIAEAPHPLHLLKVLSITTASLQFTFSSQCPGVHPNILGTNPVILGTHLDTMPTLATPGPRSG